MRGRRGRIGGDCGGKEFTPYLEVFHLRGIETRLVVNSQSKWEACGYLWPRQNNRPASYLTIEKSICFMIRSL